MDISSGALPLERGRDVKTDRASIGTRMSQVAMNLIASEELTCVTADVDTFRDRPFVIRGHHLRFLAPLMAPMAIPPETMATELRRDSVKDRGDLTEATVDFSVLSVTETVVKESEVDAFKRVYTFDLVGETPLQANRFEHKLLETLKTFLSLPDDATVELTATKKDEVCGACTFQKHCEVPAEMEADVPFLGVYEDVIRHLAATGRDVEDPVEREDGSLYTTAKSVREVMSYFAIGGKFGYDTGYVYV